MASSKIKSLKKICGKGTILENRNEDGYYETSHFTHHGRVKTAIISSALYGAIKSLTVYKYNLMVTVAN